MKRICGGLLVLTIAASGVRAQETAPDTQAGIDELEPAVSSEQLMQERAEQDERDELEPGVSSTVLAADIRRRESATGVMDELDLGRTEITGNQELPKVMYIVPWQKSDPGDMTGKPVNTLLDEVLAPVDRTEFMRQVDYYGDLYGEKDE